MSIDYEILATLTDPKTKQVLHSVVRGRAVRLRQLITKDVTQSDALRAIKILKEAQLIKETPAPIDELKTYFITASGLQIDRLVKELNGGRGNRCNHSATAKLPYSCNRDY